VAVNFLDKNAYGDAMTNCLIDPTTSLQCIHLCLVGKASKPDATCVQKCQQGQ